LTSSRIWATLALRLHRLNRAACRRGERVHPYLEIERITPPETQMKKMTWLKLLALPMFAVAIAAFAVGCEEDSDMENAAEDAGNAMEDAADDTGNAIEDAANDAGNAMEDAENDMEDSMNDE
jgi:hypothetical protein